MRRLSTLTRVLIALLTCAYPLLVYLGVGRLSPVALALGLAALMALRAWAARRAAWLLAAGAGVLLALFASLMDGSWLPLKLYPVLVSLALLGLFGASVLRPPSVIERIARLTDPALSPQGVAYTHRLTLVWCGFFAFNGSVALATVLWGSDEAWLIYNGLVAYVLMGTLFAGEWLLRQRLLARPAAAGSAHD